MPAHNRFFPSSFDPKDPTLRVIPRPAEWRWETIENALRQFGSRGVMTRLPLFWQLEIPLFHACRAVGAFLFTNDRENMPLGAAAIKHASIDCVITDADDAEAFYAFLRDGSHPLPKAWFIVHRADHGVRALSLGESRAVHEAHRSPGIPAPDHSS